MVMLLRCLLSIYAYTHRSVLLSTLTQKSSVSQRAAVKCRDSKIIKMWRGSSALNGISVSTPPSWKREVGKCKSRGVLRNAVLERDMSMYSRTHTNYGLPAQIMTVKIPA